MLHILVCLEGALILDSCLSQLWVWVLAWVSYYYNVNPDQLPINSTNKEYTLWVSTHFKDNTGGARMVQWRECLPLTIVARVWFQLGAICGLSLLLSSCLAPGFFSGFSSLPPTTKTNISKFQFDQDRSRCASSLNIVGNLFITQQNVREEIVFVRTIALFLGSILAILMCHFVLKKLIRS